MHENTGQKEKKYFTWELVDACCLMLTNDIMKKYPDYKERFKGVITFPRGGLAPAAIIANMLGLGTVMTASEMDLQIEANPDLMEGTYLLVDDISDTGETFADYVAGFTDLINAQKIQFVTVALCFRTNTAFMPEFVIQDAFDKWIVFPWEGQ